MRPRLDKRFFFSVICAFAQFPSWAETHTLDKEKTAAMLDAAAKEGIELPAPNSVNANVGVKAVLLTQGAVGRLFGKEIANTYAVVQLAISNKSADAAFVLHSAYIDTSQWALGGGTKGPQYKGTPASSGTLPNQISSVESRIARGQLLDAQQWIARNWTVRLLTVAGSLASGYTFAFKETGIAKGIAAFNGSLVPGVAFAWPDGAVAQLNRISDFGYQTNKTIGKQSADIIVCFFPIDMFLSKPFRKIFLDSPGLFLSPYQILFDNKILKELNIESQAKAAIPIHPCYSRIFELPTVKNARKGRTPAPAAESETLSKAVDDAIVSRCKSILDANKDSLIFLDYIGRFGLQNIGVYVDGIMTVDVDTVPASIDDVSFANDATQSAFWNTNGQQNGTLLCRFCQGGKVDIVEKDNLGITNVTTADDSPNDKLNFSFMITKAVPTGTIIHFVITKPGDEKKGTKDVKSAPFSYSINYPTASK